MGTEVMQPRDLLTVARVPPMPFHRRRNFVGNWSLTNLIVNWKGNSVINRKASPKSDQKKIYKGTKAKKPISAEPRWKNGFSDSGLVMGHVTLLRRGESLNSLTSKTKGGDSESTSPNQKPVEDMTVLADEYSVSPLYSSPL